jgi:hypothetical protein
LGDSTRGHGLVLHAQVSRRAAVSAVAVSTVWRGSPGGMLHLISQCWVDRLVRTGCACTLEGTIGQRGAEVHRERQRLAQRDRGAGTPRSARWRR